MTPLRSLGLYFLGCALLLGPHFIVVGCVVKPTQTQIKAPAKTAPVAPSAEKTVTQTGKTVDAIDATSTHANAVNDLDPAKKPLITGLTNARAEAVRAVERATETHTFAVAKDAEANAAQAALVEAIRAVKELAAAEATARAERDKLQAHIDEHKDDLLGPKTHRILKTMFWTLIIGGGVVIALGVLGSMYGLPSLTKPVLGSFGGLLEGLRVLLYKTATAIWAAIPFGHYPDEFLNKHGEMARQTKQTKRPEPLSNTEQLPAHHLVPAMSLNDSPTNTEGGA